MTTLAHDLAGHVVSRRLTDYSAHTIDEARTLVRDYIGVAIHGYTTDSGSIATGYQERYASMPAESTIFGTRTRISAHGAAFANAVSSHSLELDDVDRVALFHFSPPVVSAAFAVSEAVGATGEQFLTAVIVGCEIMQALSVAMNPSLRNRGFHTTPVTGVFGATAAAARVLGLDQEQVVSAFGLAGAHAAGLMEMYGPSMQKRLNPGPAAHNGIASARLAQAGFEGADTIFDGERGVLRAFAGLTSDEGRAMASMPEGGDLGLEFKPYACARPLHNAIDCALELRDEVGDLSRIANVTLHRHSDWAHYHNNPAPRTYHEAQVSINHATAVALREGTALFAQFGADRIADPEIQRLSKLMVIVPDDSLSRGVSCRLELTLTDGTTLTSTVDHPLGSLDRPMTEQHHERKFRMLTEGLRTTATQDRILSLLADLPGLKDVTELVQAITAD